jgi:hypothetical protein
MTKTIRNIIAALALTTTPVAALTDDAAKACTELGALAHQVMVNRQAGIALSKILSVIQKPEGDTSTYEMITQIIVGAYDIPRFSTRTYQIVAAEDYRNDIETACFRSLIQ